MGKKLPERNIIGKLMAFAAAAALCASLHEAGEYHPDSDEREDVKQNERKEPGVYMQADVKHGVAHQQHRNRGYDREYELVQDVRQYPVGTGDGRGG